MKKINKKIILLIIAIIFIIITYFFSTKDKDYLESYTNEEIEENNENTIITETKKKIIVYVAGAVKNEGIYELEENSRIADCIEIAGGLTEEANIKEINLAYFLEDGMKVYIPNKNDVNKVEDQTNEYVTEEKESTEISVSERNSTNTKNKKININKATQAELETLSGIGPSTAKKIIDYRETNGKFKNIEDIKKVSGIGESKYSKIKDYITI